ncbi:hypothetical protein pb186bvf_012014 [Paramecium bursaria]
MFVIIYLIQSIQAQYNRVLLIDTPPVDMNCLALTNAGIYNTDKGNNGFFGTQFFYPTLSNNGAITSFSELTFTGFIWFNKYNINGGKQVIFYFVDGYQNTLNVQPYVNLGLSFQYRNNILRLQALSGNPYNGLVVQELLMNSSNTDSLSQQWYNFVVSVKIQTDKLQFLNMKLYGMQTQSFWNYQIPYIQNNTFAFTFSQYSRITNERLMGYDTDTRLCGSLAKFNVYIGFSTMDYEYYVDYEAIPLHLVRGIGSLTSQLSLPLNSSVNNLTVVGKGIRIFKNTQIIYTFPQNYDNLTISFWLYAQTTDEFQILSLVESDKQSISIGLGIDSSGKLLLYSRSSTQQVTLVGTKVWQQVGLSFTRRIYSANFQPQTDQTIVKVILNGRTTQSQLTLLTVSYFKYLYLGPIFPQNRDSQYFDMNDLRIYQGFSFIQWSNYDCYTYLSIGNKSACIRCGTSSSQFCFESPIPSTMDITKYYNCTAGYQEAPGCPPVTIANCARQNGTTCNYCNYGYNLTNNSCIIQSQFFVSVQDCSNSALYCQISNNNQLVVVCNGNLQYTQNKCVSNSTYIAGNCSHVYQVNSSFLGCYNCVLGTLNLKFKCVNDCSSQQYFQSNKNIIFNDNWCTQTCPYYYDYFRNCTSKTTQISCVTSCQNGSVLNNISCIYPKQQTINGQTESCWFQKNDDKTIKNWQRILDCDKSCQYCYYPSENQCLSCSNPNYFFDPIQSKCLKQCDKTSILAFSDAITQQCVSQCDSTRYIQGSYCYNSCPTGYYPFNKQCIQQAPLNAYLDTVVQQFKACPFLCYTCLDAVTCTKCMTNYFLVKNTCQLTCYPLSYYDGISDCVSSCPANSYQYSNSNLNGFPVSYCFQYGCGQVWAGIPFTTYLHQSNPYQCVLVCDPGYYGNQITASCSPCTNNCASCVGSSTSCLSCVPGVFKSGNQCFSSCPIYADYINWVCVSSCPVGSYIATSANACLPTCGQYLPLYNKVYQQNCYDTPPAGVGCDATNQCYPCDSTCVTCNGPANTNCLSCYPNTYLMNQFCGTDCGTLLYDLKTWLCSSSCSIGTFKQGQYCSTTCLNGYYQFQNSCFESTPTGAYCLYSNSKKMYLCDPCYTGCKTCTDNSPNSCGSCYTGYYYYQNICYTTCPAVLPIMESFTNLCTDTCAPQYYLYDNVCQTSCTTLNYKVQGQNLCFSNGCGSGSYAIPLLPGCFACSPSCAQCQTQRLTARAANPIIFWLDRHAFPNVPQILLFKIKQLINVSKNAKHQIIPTSIPQANNIV